MEQLNQRPRIDSLKFENISFSHDHHEPTLNRADFEFPMNENHLVAIQ